MIQLSTKEKEMVVTFSFSPKNRKLAARLGKIVDRAGYPVVVSPVIADVVVVEDVETALELKKESNTVLIYTSRNIELNPLPPGILYVFLDPKASPKHHALLQLLQRMESHFSFA